MSQFVRAMRHENCENYNHSVADIGKEEPHMQLNGSNSAATCTCKGEADRLITFYCLQEGKINDPYVSFIPA